jgi:hypothetical protein
MFCTTVGSMAVVGVIVQPAVGRASLDEYESVLAVDAE